MEKSLASKMIENDAVRSSIPFPKQRLTRLLLLTARPLNQHQRQSRRQTLEGNKKFKKSCTVDENVK